MTAHPARARVGLIVLLAASLRLEAQAAATARDYPIIDMHLHAMRANSYGPPPQPMCMGQVTFLGWNPAERLNPGRLVSCDQPALGAANDEDLLQKTIAILQRHNIIGVTSGPRLAAWQAAAPDRIIPGLLTAFGNVSVDSLRVLLSSGTVKVLGEVTTQYNGLAPNAPELDPFWKLAAELDVPVGIHMASMGPPGQPYLGRGGYRAANGNPLTLEDVLAKHPRLRVYLMHAGFPQADDLISLMVLYPQVYAEIGLIGWMVPRAAFHRFLERIVEAGMGQRIMFGSDQMVWPSAIETTIEAIETASFLNATQKRDIFYENARRFLRLPK